MAEPKNWVIVGTVTVLGVGGCALALSLNPGDSSSFGLVPGVVLPADVDDSSALAAATVMNGGAPALRRVMVGLATGAAGEAAQSSWFVLEVPVPPATSSAADDSPITIVEVEPDARASSPTPRRVAAAPLTSTAGVAPAPVRRAAQPVLPAAQASADSADSAD